MDCTSMTTTRTSTTIKSATAATPTRLTSFGQSPPATLTSFRDGGGEIMNTTSSSSYTTTRRDGAASAAAAAALASATVTVSGVSSIPLHKRHFRKSGGGGGLCQDKVFMIWLILSVFVLAKVSIETQQQQSTGMMAGTTTSRKQALLRDAFQKGLPMPPSEDLERGERYQYHQGGDGDDTNNNKNKDKAILDSLHKEYHNPHENRDWNNPNNKKKKKKKPLPSKNKQQPRQIPQEPLVVPQRYPPPLKNSNNEPAASGGSSSSSKARKSDSHAVAGLSCQSHGGPMITTNNKNDPDNEKDAEQRRVLSDMVYWRDIPSDATWISPHAPKKGEPPRYLTFEPDEGGFNNIRMAFETAVTLAVSTGRILVLPPEMNFYLLTNPRQHQSKSFGFADFYDLHSIASEHAGLKIISFEQFLETVAMKGQLLHRTTGEPAFPPNNRTDWNGMPANFIAYRMKKGRELWNWMRNVTWAIDWEPSKCVAVVPKEPGPEAFRELVQTWKNLKREDQKRWDTLNKSPALQKRPNLQNMVWQNRFHSFDDHPTPVDAPAQQRLSEMLAQRTALCVYNQTLQQAQVIHVLGEQDSGARMLVHFYAFLFFQNYEHDLWVKRFVRDHLRYHDDIQCAAARIVLALRRRARANDQQTDEEFHAMHIRRGDFQFTKVRNMTADEIIDNVKRWFTPGKVLYIATDEKDRTFFEPLQRLYKVYFMSDFQRHLTGVDSHYLGMIDQLVAAQSDVFTGVFYSTFTGYINRIRGYLSQKRKLEGHKRGIIRSYYYVPPSLAPKRKVMLRYQAVEPAFWQREFPVAWRDLDRNVVVDAAAIAAPEEEAAASEKDEEEAG